MRNTPWSLILQISLVIFALLFGAGNLMLPLRVGMLGGDLYKAGLFGFILAGILLPLIGLIAIIDFDGDYNAFFGRLGRVPGSLFIFLCILIIGPVIVMPRIVTLSYEMMSPFLPTMPVWFFSVLFLMLVFFATYKPSRLLTIIGKFLSPFKVVSLVTIILIGVIKSGALPHSNETWGNLFKIGAEYGYGTLDLLGTIFFGSIVVKLLKRDKDHPMSRNERIKVAGIAGVAAATLLGLVYSGMCLLGAAYGEGLAHLNEGQLFSSISLRILGPYGGALIGFTVFIACFTTTVALSAVVTDYISNTVLKQKVKYSHVLVGILGVCMIPASMGLSAIMKYSMPFIKTMYPVLIVLALCNFLYKLVGFKPVKIPVFLMAAFMAVYSLINSGIL